MSITSIATAAAVAQTAQTRTELATIITKQNHEAEAALVDIIDAATQNLAQITSSAPAGTGQTVDISV